MSENQYYEFLAIDHPLDAAAQGALRSISSRARITANSFTNHYEWGSLKAAPLDMMTRWFDVHVYTGFWSSRTLMIRLPRRLFDADAAFLYAFDGSFEIEEAGANLVLVFQAHELEIAGVDDGADGSGWLAALTPLRAALMEGDQRCLYLAWLLAVQNGAVEDEDREPPRPPGLGRRDGALRAFADFFALDPDLLAASALGDDRPDPVASTPEALESFIDALPSSEKTALLLRLVRGDAPTLVSELRRRCREALPAAPVTPLAERRRVADLRRAAGACAVERRRLAAEQAAVEQARRDRDAAEARSRRLETLSRRGESAWREVENEIDTRQSAGYDRAVALLVDLRALAERNGTVAAFQKRLFGFRARHARKGNFIGRLDQAGLSD